MCNGMNPSSTMASAKLECSVNLCGPHSQCLLVKVRLRLFTLDGATEAFQIFLHVRNRVVRLQQGKRQRDGEIIGRLRSTDNISPAVHFAAANTYGQKENSTTHDGDKVSGSQSQAINSISPSFRKITK